MPSDGARLWLGDIVENCERIARHVAGMTRASYGADEKTMDAVERCLERICEAAIRLKAHERVAKQAPALERLYPDVDWDAVRGLGNVLRHRYDTIDDEQIWYAISEKLTPLANAARREIARLSRTRR
jgi:uncharacterized protein with HEPN domain